MRAATDLRALLATCEAATGEEWDGATTDLTEWMLEHGEAVLALLDAAQWFTPGHGFVSRDSELRARDALAAAVRRLTEETT